ncbi:MAG: PepSY domain-containing protein [Candidimonas sp.]|nr:MAG: PepSY domain-containing protein [Candidimonas sp.]
MRHYHKILGGGLLALSAVLAAAPALAGDDCDAPVEHWQSRDAVRRMASEKGWQVQRLKIDDGCYEVRGTDANGRGFKAKIDPETLEVVELRQRDHKRERERDREREHRSGGVPAAAGGQGPATAPSPLFTPGTAPRGQVE